MKSQGFQLAPVAAQQVTPSVDPTHGTSAYQGSSVAHPGGVTIQPEREADVYSRGSAPLTARGVLTAVNNAMSLMADPVITGAKTLASNLAGVPAGGLQTVPGYVGPDPVLRARVDAGLMTANQAAALDQARAAAGGPRGISGGDADRAARDANDSDPRGNYGGGGYGGHPGLRRGGRTRRKT